MVFMMAPLKLSSLGSDVSRHRFTARTPLGRKMTVTVEAKSWCDPDEVAADVRSGKLSGARCYAVEPLELFFWYCYFAILLCFGPFLMAVLWHIVGIALGYSVAQVFDQQSVSSSWIATVWLGMLAAGVIGIPGLRWWWYRR